jgi:hypothetical protein
VVRVSHPEVELVVMAVNVTLYHEMASSSKMEEWRRYYNEDRSHSGIGQVAPILLHNSGGASSPSLANEAENSGLR